MTAPDAHSSPTSASHPHQTSAGHRSDADSPLESHVAPPSPPLRSSYLSSRGTSVLELAVVVILALGILIPGISAYTLVDPWETHYSEVARRMLQDGDWVHTKWQNEGFRSKPVLTFWLIAASMRTMGLAEDGGFSGEMTSSALVMFAVRLPFVLSAVGGMAALFWMLASLVNRRTAWLAFLVLMSTPFFSLVARQAITDMPMVASLMAAMACFIMALHAGDTPLRPIFGGRPFLNGRFPLARIGRINGLHIFAAVMVLFTGWQIVYYAIYFVYSPGLGAGVRFPVPHLIVPGVMALALGFFWFWALVLQPTRYARQLYMYWFYLLLAVSVLAKGLPAIGLAGLICFAYILLTGNWRLITKVEIPRGILICLIIVVPWHVCMILKDGRPFVRDYFINHLWRRAAVGVHGERGTFNFFIDQLGIGMWPWAGILPAAIAGVIGRILPQTPAGRVRMVCALWAVVSVAFFSAIQTKFHHYILPAVPALAILIAFWLDDMLQRRIPHVTVALIAAAAVVAIICRDLMAEQKRIIELFVYRYDRPWPAGEPWNIDLSDPLFGFGAAFAIILLLMSTQRLRRLALAAFITASLLFGFWVNNVYMHHAGTHWGMRQAVQTYYRLRTIQGQDIIYRGAYQITEDWDGFSGRYQIRSVIPETLAVGQPMTVRIELRPGGAGGGASAGTGNSDGNVIALRGTVAEIGDNRFWVDIPAEQVAQLAPLIERGRRMPKPRQAPWRQVRADRLIAWQLYWRGENFWSNDEIWGQSKDTQTAFQTTDNKAFLEYINAPERKNRRYFLMTESGRARNLKSILPNSKAKESYQILDTSSNKFTLLSFEM